VSVGDPRPADVWRGQRNRFLLEEARTTGQWLHAFGGVVQLVMLLIFLDGGYPTWRVTAAAAVFIAFVLLQKAWIRTSHDALSYDRVFIATNLSAQTMFTVIVGLTGGLQSPTVPSLLLPSVISLLFFGPHAVARWIAFASALLIVAMGLLPQSLVGPLLPSGHYALVLSVGLGWNLFLLHMMVGKMTRAASKAGRSKAPTSPSSTTPTSRCGSGWPARRRSLSTRGRSWIWARRCVDRVAGRTPARCCMTRLIGPTSSALRRAKRLT
jgi:hypothetical protein